MAKPDGSSSTSSTSGSRNNVHTNPSKNINAIVEKSPYHSPPGVAATICKSSATPNSANNSTPVDSARAHNRKEKERMRKTLRENAQRLRALEQTMQNLSSAVSQQPSPPSPTSTLSSTVHNNVLRENAQRLRALEQTMQNLSSAVSQHPAPPSSTPTLSSTLDNNVKSEVCNNINPAARVTAQAAAPRVSPQVGPQVGPQVPPQGPPQAPSQMPLRVPPRVPSQAAPLTLPQAPQQIPPQQIPPQQIPPQKIPPQQIPPQQIPPRIPPRIPPQIPPQFPLQIPPQIPPRNAQVPMHASQPQLQPTNSQLPARFAVLPHTQFHQRPPVVHASQPRLNGGAAAGHDKVRQHSATQGYHGHGSLMGGPFNLQADNHQHNNNITLTSPDSLDGFAGLVSSPGGRNENNSHSRSSKGSKNNSSSVSLDFSVNDLASASSSLDLFSSTDGLLLPTQMGIGLDPHGQPPARRPAWFGMPF